MKRNDLATFCRALWRGEARVVERLASIVDPNGQNRWGHTPLLMAVEYGDLPLVSLLVRRGAEVDQGRTLLTPITLAARRGDSGMVEFLRDRGATLSIVTWVYLGDEKRIVQALKRDPRLVHIRDELGTPLLHHGVEALRPPIVMLLLDRGAKVDDTDQNA